MPFKLIRRITRNKRLPLWKWILIIIMILALPLFFLSYRSAQTQRAIAQTETQ